MSKEFNPELEKWAEEVIEECTPIEKDKETTLSFYPFQSKVKMNPKLLIIGLNPREDESSYESQILKWGFEKPSENDRKIRGENRIMFPETLLRGNFRYEEKQVWDVIKGLEGIDFIEKAIKSNDYCFMNYIFYATKDEKTLKSLKNFKQIEERCTRFTKKLIDIINPFAVIVLGVGASDKLVSNKKVILKRDKNLIVQGIVKGEKETNVYCIFHPSRLKSYLDKSLIDYVLSNVLQKKEVPFINFNYTSFDIKKVISLLKEECKVKVEKMSQKKEYYQFICKGLTEDEIDFRIDLEDKVPYFAFRSKDFEKGVRLNKTDLYMESFKDAKSIKYWEVHKKLYQYSGKIEKELVDEIRHLLEKIKKSR